LEFAAGCVALYGVSTGPSTSQPELFALEEIEGYGVLTRRERLFAEALFEGKNQREAAIAAGITGTDEVINVSASKLVRSVKVRKLMNQAWDRAGASIETTLRQAAQLQQQAFLEATTASNRDERLEAFKKWKDASTLIASIHGKLQVKVDSTVTHLAGPGMVLIPENALAGFAELRRTVEVHEINGGKS
jgi:hypothetical protein